MQKRTSDKVAKVLKSRTNIGQFNDTLLIDFGYEKDSLGKTHGFAVMVDEGTDWCVVKYLSSWKTAGELYKIVEEGWIDWDHQTSCLVTANADLHQKSLPQSWEKPELSSSHQQVTHLGRKARLSERLERYAQSSGRQFYILELEALKR